VTKLYRVPAAMNEEQVVRLHFCRSIVEDFNGSKVAANVEEASKTLKRSEEVGNRDAHVDQERVVSLGASKFMARRTVEVANSWWKPVQAQVFDMDPILHVRDRRAVQLSRIRGPQ